MKLEIEVKRIRFSVTQGEAAVYVNGEKVIQFGDKIEIIQEGQPYYSEKIGGFASVKPDADFIKGLLWHPFDDMYHYSDKVKEILDAETERMKGMDTQITMLWDVKQDGCRARCPHCGAVMMLCDSCQGECDYDYGNDTCKEM